MENLQNISNDDPAPPSEISDPSGGAMDVAAPATRNSPAFVEQFVGVIRGSSCSGGGDYADARYCIDRAIARQSLQASDLLSTDTDTLPGVKQCITATNLAELADGTHSLPAGTVVQVFALYTRGQPAARLYVFNFSAQSPAVVVKISGAASGAGEYSGAILTGNASTSDATDLGMPAGLSAGSDDALVLNSEEDGLGGHRLASGSYAVGVVKGFTAETPPRKIVFIRGGVGRLDSPATLGNTSEGSESASSASWTKSTSAAPLNLYMVSRTVYNESGDKTLYQFVRQLTFDARGQLTAASGETRVTIDVTESCP